MKFRFGETSSSAKHEGRAEELVGLSPYGCSSFTIIPDRQGPFCQGEKGPLFNVCRFVIKFKHDLA
ncbi:hypothetical protein GCM10011571_26810 [Marinithermofilum abyssi]|uniref:Uncharacterized protein n=1 Tax=Marinithermofilum abyssi TaxID=1571185 RepID=A0A8J2VC85_9BACL|nr:hypothetical protein GCM10011571_26810 [Marinithermofilum abyssi]